MKKSKMPLVSIIIPTCNRPQYFKQALESALNQTYKKIEVVVSDNSAGDETENLIQQYLKKDRRVKYFHHKNFSADDNWNWISKYNNPAAEYVNFLMDDNIFYPEKIRIMLEFYMEDPKISLITSRRNFIDSQGKVIYKLWSDINSTGYILNNVAARLLFTVHQGLIVPLNKPDNFEWGLFTSDNYIGGLTDVLIRKKFLRNNVLCYFDDEKIFYPMADFSTWLQLLSKGNLGWINEPLSATRLHSARIKNFNGNEAIIAMFRAKLIKYFWESKIFLDTKAEVRRAFCNWIELAANAFRDAKDSNYHGDEIAALEDLNIAMAEALHSNCNIILPPSVKNILERFMR